MRPRKIFVGLVPFSYLVFTTLCRKFQPLSSGKKDVSIYRRINAKYSKYTVEFTLRPMLLLFSLSDNNSDFVVNERIS